MYQYPLDQTRLGKLKLVSVATQEFDGQISMRDDKPVRLCSVLATPPDDRPEVMTVNIPHVEQYDLPEMTPVTFKRLTVRARVSKRNNTLVYVIEADDMTPATSKDGDMKDKPNTPAGTKPAVDPVKPFGLK